VISLTLAGTTALPAPRPGQFVVLRLQTSEATPPIFRSYSLSGPPSTTEWRISVKLEPHGMAGTYLHTRVREGDVVEVSSPRGAFALEDGDGPVVMMSAGIGATPVLAMLYALVAARSTRQVWWLHGSRSSATHPFAVEVRSLLARLARGRSHIVYSRPTADDRASKRFDATGHLDVATLRALGVPAEADFYLCGPQAFLEDLRVGLASFGASRVYTEIFGGSASSTPGIAAAAQPKPRVPEGASVESGDGPLVSFARSGLVVRAAAKYRSLLELAEAASVPVRWSCRTGVCHSCESGLLSGAVGYEPAPLDPPPVGNVLICCSRPRSDVVLDL
jgi:ferredoxin-NADP reductase